MMCNSSARITGLTSCYPMHTSCKPLVKSFDLQYDQSTTSVLNKVLRGGAGKSLARPGRKQATATKLGIYSTYSPRSSVHFLVRCSIFWKPLTKNSEDCPFNQVSAAAMTSASDEKWRPFSCSFSPGNTW